RPREIDPPRDLPGQVLDVRERLVETPPVTFRAVLPDVQVRVLPRRQRHDLHLEAVLQQDFEAAARRSPPRRVRVEVHDDAIGVSLQKPDVARRESRTERPDGLADSGLVEGNDIHVTLDQDRVPVLPYRLPGLRQAVEVLTLAE